MSARSALSALPGNVRFLRYAIGVLATLSLALLVAAIVARDPPEFSSMPIVAVVRDGEQHPVWAIRLARAAHQIAADSLRSEGSARGHAYQLWLSVPGRYGAAPTRLLPQSGRKRIAVSPQNARLLAAGGELVVDARATGRLARSGAERSGGLSRNPRRLRVESASCSAPWVDCGAGFGA